MGSGDVTLIVIHSIHSHPECQRPVSGLLLGGTVVTGPAWDQLTLRSRSRDPRTVRPENGFTGLDSYALNSPRQKARWVWRNVCRAACRLRPGAGSMPCSFRGAAHGCIREGIPEVGQGALDAVATPGRVFACQPHHQGADLAVIPLLGHEQAASTQSALRCSPPAAFRDPQWLPYTTQGRQDRWRFFRSGRAEAPGGEEEQKKDLIPLRIAL
jgi:hypothetical protein